MAIASGALLVSCSQGNTETSNETAEATETAETTEVAESATWTVNTDESNVRWEGGTAGAMVYSHFGSIKIKSGSVTTDGGAISGGTFEIDMTTINPEDDGYSEDHPASDLVGHLSTPDFFNTAEFPTASFTVKSMDGNTITGDLTIRGNTNEETIALESMEIAEGNMSATGTLVFDRQKYDVAWAHYMEDVILSDDITLNITLVAAM